MLVMVAIGGAVILTAQFKRDGRQGRDASVRVEDDIQNNKADGQQEAGKMAVAEETAEPEDGKVSSGTADGERGESVRSELVDLYFHAFCQLIHSHSGLERDVACFGFDFSQAGSLTVKEGEALALRLKKKFYKSKVIYGTFEQLKKDGYIKNDRGGMRWPNGVLLTLQVTREERERIVFYMSMWRSGLGAAGMDDCVARHVKERDESGEGGDGKWEFDFDASGNFWIS